MDELMDMMIDDASASQISDTMKDILFAKSAERVDTHRSTTANSLFGADQSEPEEVEDSMSDEEEVVAVADDEI
jgi:hypothetical protein